MTAAGDPSLRLFVAIELQRDWLAVLETYQSQLRAAIEQQGGPRLRWVRPEGIHLTLKFLGQVRQKNLEPVHQALKEAFPKQLELEVVLARPGAFGDRRGPRVIWAGVEGSTPEDRDKLYQLAEGIETSLAAVGFPPEGRFNPHLTLARLPEELKKEQRQLAGDLIASLKLQPVSPMVVRTASLMRSHLGPGGARYERIASYP